MTAATPPFFSNARELRIEWGHCDPAGIVFNPRFFEFFDWSTALLFEAALGLTKPEMLRAYDAAGIPLVESRAKFLRPCRYGDRVEIKTTAIRLGASSFDIGHILFNAGQPAVEAFETRVWTARDPAYPDRIKARPLPDEVARRLRGG